MKSTDEVLALARVDAGLPADGRIHLCEQRCRHLYEIQPAPGTGCGKARKIADHPAAERSNEIVTLDPRRDDRLAYFFEGRVVLRGLACRHDNMRTIDCRRFERSFGGGEMMAGDRFIGYDRHARAWPQVPDAR